MPHQILFSDYHNLSLPEQFTGGLGLLLFCFLIVCGLVAPLKLFSAVLTIYSEIADIGFYIGSRIRRDVVTDEDSQS